MEKISRIDPERADEKVRALLEDVHDRLGMVPNAMKVMANAPAVLRMALESERILNEGLLAPRLREQIALAVSEFNGSRYCISAHTALAGIAGLSEEEIEDARSGTSPDRRTESALSSPVNWLKNEGPSTRGESTRCAGPAGRTVKLWRSSCMRP
jgi:AhpD family alkylhydroperoxidase